jgi:hypothetical protein
MTLLFIRPHIFFIDSYPIGPHSTSIFMDPFMGLQESDILQTKFSCKEDQVAFLNSYNVTLPSP